LDVVLDREELYRDVWSKRASAVARKYGLDEGDIRRACFALDVPRPARGYWTKLRTGDAPPVPPLPQKNGASTYTCKTISRASKGALNPKPAKPKESLVDWVVRTTPPEHLKPQYRAQPSAAQVARHPKYVPLGVWAQLMFGEHAPHVNTLRAWVRDGRIQPQPRKMGRQWFVKVDAEYVSD
jgi:hypothetical protein